MSVATDRADALRQLEREVAVMVRRVRRVIKERARLVHPELQPSSYLMLGHIRDEGPLRASEMCEVFDLDKGAVSRLVQHLLELGLVDRTPDPDDGRATLVAVSAQGSQRLTDVADHRRKLLDERLGDWSAEELAAFAAELNRYNAALA
ncbi:MAG TPA: MarR family transcriptional regulator [Nocardioides sp.]|nr:MarR family transcriptional regulator [Nocardioides sp.]